MDPDVAEEAPGVETAATSAAESPKIVKRKVAMHLGYVGTGYHGGCYHVGAIETVGDKWEMLDYAIGCSNCDDIYK